MNVQGFKPGPRIYFPIDLVPFPSHLGSRLGVLGTVIAYLSKAPYMSKEESSWWSHWENKVANLSDS